MPSETTKPVIDPSTLKLEHWTQGTLYEGTDISFGKLLGLSNLGVSYNEVPPGKSSCPFHNHHVEDELFIVLEGEGTYRFGTGSFSFKAGDVLGAPAGGRDTAHQIINTGAGPLRSAARPSRKARTSRTNAPGASRKGKYPTRLMTWHCVAGWRAPTSRWSVTAWSRDETGSCVPQISWTGTGMPVVRYAS